MTRTAQFWISLYEKKPVFKKFPRHNAMLKLKKEYVQQWIQTHGDAQ
jgi:hypothetical protein